MKKRLVSILLAVLLIAVAFVGCGEKKAESGQLENIVTELKTLYGDNYLPTDRMDETLLTDLYGVNKEDVKEAVVEGSMISMHVDVFVGVEAAEGKAEAVETALAQYRQTLIEDTMQYPMNMLKIEASTVLRVDDYVFFIMLGGYNDEFSEDEEKTLEFFKEQTKKGVDKINQLLGK